MNEDKIMTFIIQVHMGLKANVPHCCTKCIGEESSTASLCVLPPAAELSKEM